MLFQFKWRNCPCALQIDQSGNAAEIGGVGVGMERAAMFFQIFGGEEGRIPSEKLKHFD